MSATRIVSQLTVFTLISLTSLFSLTTQAVSVDTSQHYFQDASGKPVFLIGYYDWASVAQNFLLESPARYQDMINAGGANGLNYIRISLGVNRVPSTNSPIPFKVINGKADLDQWDPVFWAGLRYHCNLARQKGMLVHVAFFDGVDIRPGNGWWRWGGSFWNIDNQVGNFFGDIDTNNNGNADQNGDFYRVNDFNNNTGVGKYQRLVIDKAIAETASYNNVFFEVGNELFGASSAWNQAVISYVQSKTSKPITQNQGGKANNLDGWAQHVASSLSGLKSSVSQIVDKGYPAWEDPDGPSFFMNGNADSNRRAAWYSFAGGAAGWGGFSSDFWNNSMDNDKLTYYGHLMDFISDSKVEFWKMTASHNLVSNSGENSCLAQVGEEYVVYVLNDSSVSLNLSSVNGDSRVRTFNPRTGDWVSIEIVPGGGTESFAKPPGADDWVVHVKKNGGGGSAPPPPPLPPSNLVVTALSSSAIGLSWEDNADNETNFQIERKTGGGAFSAIATVNVNTTSYTDSGLEANTSYSYRVRAQNAAGNSGYTNTATATTDNTVPSKPSGLSASPSSSSVIQLTWIDNSGNETSFRVERKSGSGAFREIGTVGVNTTSYTDSGLAANTVYSYRVRAQNTAGSSGYTNTATARTNDTQPNVPSGLSASPSSSSVIQLAWTDNSGNETSFRVERKTGSGAFSEIGTVGANTPSYTDSGLAANTAYSYRVRAQNAAGNSSYSNTATATTDNIVPSKPSGLSASATSSSVIQLAWTDNADNETSFRVERKTGSGAFSEIGTVGANTPSYTDSGLAANTVYSYRVRAQNAAGSSGYTNTATARTNDTQPNAPSALSASATSSSVIQLAWTDNADNETSFRVERKTGSGAFSEIGTVGANTPSYTDSGLAANTVYSYRVRAQNAAGSSGYTNTVTARTNDTQPNAPSALSASATSSSVIQLAWTDNAGNETSFRVERKTGSGEFLEIGTVGANTPSYTDSGLDANTAYSYRVRAQNAVGNSSYSNTATATTDNIVPSKPSGLSASATSSSVIQLAWTDNADNETSFRVERKTGSGAFSEIGTVGANTPSYTDSGLAANTVYSYRVRAQNAAGSSGYTNTATARTNDTQPNAPSALSASATSSSVIQLAWTDNAGNETSFRVERKTGSGEFLEIGTVGANTPSYTDSGLDANTAYSYRVRAQNAAGNSSYSNTATATTDNIVPSKPSGLSASATSSSVIQLAWIDNSGNETSFRVERRRGSGTFREIGTVGANTPSYTDSGLDANTAYSYRVRAQNAVGNSSYSNTATATTDNIVPSKPSGLSASATSSSVIQLAWTDNADNETSFRVERRRGSGTFREIGTVGANTPSYTDSGLDANTAYSYRVRAQNAVGNSSYSNTATATTDNIVPSKPSGLSASATSSSVIQLAWTDNADNETSFRVERKTGSGAFSEIGTVGVNTTSYTDSGLAANTVYSYRVRAQNAAGSSGYTNTVTARTNDTQPNAPSGLSASATSSSVIQLAWIDNSGNETSFRVERRRGSGTFREIGTVGANTPSYTDSGLDANTAYSYRVRAQNAVGNSSYSNTATGRTTDTQPDAPSGLSASATSSSAIQLAWTDNSRNEVSFRIERRKEIGGFTEIATVSANTVSYIDSGLEADTIYTYRIRAQNAVGTSGYSNTAAATTNDTKPSAPSSLSATASSSSSIQLVWADNSSNETSFRIERKTGAGSFIEIVAVNANTISYTDSGLEINTTYNYRVRAQNSAGSSVYSNTTTVKTHDTKPNPPSGLLVKALSATSIELTWVDKSTNETTFHIERREGNGAFSEIASVNANATTYTDTGLKANTPYSYRIRARNVVGDSAYSTTTSAKTNDMRPNPPSGLSAKALSASSIELTWADMSTNETSFHVERRLGNGSFFEIAALSANTTTYADNGLEVDAIYSYRVRAENSVGRSEYSNTTTGKTLSNETDFPVILQGKQLPEEVTISLDVFKPSNVRAEATLTMLVYDADFAEEGILSVNNKGSIVLFGASGRRHVNDQRTVTVEMTTPSEWWQDGKNALRFIHTRTNGFRIESVSVDFTKGTSLGSEPENGFPVKMDGSRLPEKKTITIDIHKPSTFQGEATLLMLVYDPDFSKEGKLIINGDKGALDLFGNSAEKGFNNQSVIIAMSTPADWWEDGKNTLEFIHRKTFGYWIESLSVNFNVGEASATSETNSIAGGLKVKSLRASAWASTNGALPEFMDPASAAYPGELLSWTLYEDAEDGAILGWSQYEGGDVSNIRNGAEGSERAIEITGNIERDVFRFANDDGSDWNNEKEFFVEFSLALDQSNAGVVYFQVDTNVGIKYLAYGDSRTLTSNNSEFIYVGLGDIADGRWYGVFVDLEQDLLNAVPNAELYSVKSLFVYGSLKLDNIRFLGFATTEPE